MSRKTVLSIFLIILGVITGLLVIFAYSMSGGRVSIALPFMAAAIACIITGSIVGFSRLLDRTIRPVLDEIYLDLEDDLQDLKEHRLPGPIWMAAILGIAALVFFFFVLRFHKIEAMWGSIPVVLVVAVGMGALAWLIPLSRWYRNSQDTTPLWVFFVPTAGLILSVFLGLSNTENMRAMRSLPQEPIAYNAFQPSGSDLQILYLFFDMGSGINARDCDNDACAAIMLLIALVILTLILVAGSAVIPHFWVFSGSIMLCIMALITIHDLRIRRAKPEVKLKTGLV